MRYSHRVRGQVSLRGPAEAGRARDRPDAVLVRFWIEDTGIGIPPERQQLIFDEYMQADRKIARRFGGTGLGLAITAKLVELQGGHPSLKSEPGRGSTFAFEIPLRRVT